MARSHTRLDLKWQVGLAEANVHVREAMARGFFGSFALFFRSSLIWFLLFPLYFFGFTFWIYFSFSNFIQFFFFNSFHLQNQHSDRSGIQHSWKNNCHAFKLLEIHQRDLTLLDRKGPSEPCKSYFLKMKFLLLWIVETGNSDFLSI